MEVVQTVMVSPRGIVRVALVCVAPVRANAAPGPATGTVSFLESHRFTITQGMSESLSKIRMNNRIRFRGFTQVLHAAQKTICVVVLNRPNNVADVTNQWTGRVQRVSGV